MAETAVDTNNDRNRVRAVDTNTRTEEGPSREDVQDVQRAADIAKPDAVTAQAAQTVDPSARPADSYRVAETAGPVNGARSRDNPAAFLADTTMTQTQMSERLRAMSTPDLTRTVRGVDDKSLDHGKNVTPDGWQALHSEVDRRFREATKQGDFNSPDLAELSQATVRQRDFGGQSKPWSEKGWRDVATSMAAVNRRSDETAAKTYQTLRDTQRLVQDHVNGSTSPKDMTNAQLLNRVQRIPGMKIGGEILAATGIPGMLAQAAGNAKAEEALTELNSRFNDGRIDEFEPNTGTDSNVGTALGVVSTALQIGNPRNWVKNGIDRIRGWFSKKAKTDVDDAASRIQRQGDDAKALGAAREADAANALRERGLDVRRWNQEFGNTEIDLMMTTPQGRYGVLVGGNAKALRNGRIDDEAVNDSLEKYRRANELLTDPDGPFRGDGAGAMMAFPKSTDPRVIERFIKELGAQRVLVF